PKVQRAEATHEETVHKTRITTSPSRSANSTIHWPTFVANPASEFPSQRSHTEIMDTAICVSRYGWRPELELIFHPFPFARTVALRALQPMKVFSSSVLVALILVLADCATAQSAKDQDKQIAQLQEKL